MDTFDDTTKPTRFPNMRLQASHYYGDVVRVLMVVAAVVILITEFTVHDLPFSTGAVIGLVVILVIAAGITNPAQMWIHWVNLFIIIGSVMVFGTIAINRFQQGTGGSHAVLYGLLALLFLVNLYFATRTVRGLIIGAKPPVS